jgi:hypothetical protein
VFPGCSSPRLVPCVTTATVAVCVEFLFLYSFYSNIFFLLHLGGSTISAVGIMHVLLKDDDDSPTETATIALVTQGTTMTGSLCYYCNCCCLCRIVIVGVSCMFLTTTGSLCYYCNCCCLCRIIIVGISCDCKKPMIILKIILFLYSLYSNIFFLLHLGGSTISAVGIMHVLLKDDDDSSWVFPVCSLPQLVPCVTTATVAPCVGLSSWAFPVCSSHRKHPR